ncbi:MAG: hypothetical protein WBL39_18545, partial [Terrimicrobiaceae bacterium]
MRAERGSPGYGSRRTNTRILMMVPMMGVGIVRVGVRHPSVLMAVSMRLPRRICGGVFVLMVLVVMV